MIVFILNHLGAVLLGVIGLTYFSGGYTAIAVLVWQGERSFWYSLFWPYHLWRETHD